MTVYRNHLHPFERGIELQALPQERTVTTSGTVTFADPCYPEPISPVGSYYGPSSPISNVSGDSFYSGSPPRTYVRDRLIPAHAAPAHPASPHRAHARQNSNGSYYAPYHDPEHGPEHAPYHPPAAAQYPAPPPAPYHAPPAYTPSSPTVEEASPYAAHHLEDHANEHIAHTLTTTTTRPHLFICDGVLPDVEALARPIDDKNPGFAPCNLSKKLFLWGLCPLFVTVPWWIGAGMLCGLPRRDHYWKEVRYWSWMCVVALVVLAVVGGIAVLICREELGLGGEVGGGEVGVVLVGKGLGV